MELSHHVTVPQVKAGNPRASFRVLPTAACPLPPICRISVDPLSTAPGPPPYLWPQLSQHVVCRRSKQVWVQDGPEGEGSGARPSSWLMPAPRGLYPGFPAFFMKGLCSWVISQPTSCQQHLGFHQLYPLSLSARAGSVSVLGVEGMPTV